MRDIYSTITSGADTSSTVSDSARSKLDKLSARVTSDYARSEEWSTQKSELALKLWRRVRAHYERLVSEVAKVNADLVESVAVTLPATPEVPLVEALQSELCSAGFGEGEHEMGEARMRMSDWRVSADLPGKKRALGSLAAASTHGGASGANSPQAFALGRASGSRAYVSTGRQRTPGSEPVDLDTGGTARGTAGVVNTPTDTAEAAFGRADGEEERDENLYCFCQRGSFGEMIGCDSDDCKYEWVRLVVLLR